MADRVPPNLTSSLLSETTPSGACVIHVPKDQLHRIRSSENARRKTRRGRWWCCCLCWFISILLVLAVLLTAAAGAFHFVFRQKAPDHAIEYIVAARGTNLTSPPSAAAHSPEGSVFKVLGYSVVQTESGRSVLARYGYELNASERRAFMKALEERSLPSTVKVWQWRCCWPTNN